MFLRKTYLLFFNVSVSDGTGNIVVVYRKSYLKFHQDSRRIISLKHRTIAKNAVLKKSWLNNPNEWNKKCYEFHDEQPPIWYSKEIPSRYVAVSLLFTIMLIKNSLCKLIFVIL